MRFVSTPRALAALFLLSGLVLGLAHTALLPPWEGFDEHAHFSYIQQVADTGYWARQDDRMSKDIDDYLKIAPGPDSIPRHWSYHNFFAAPDLVAAARDAVQSPRPRPRAWAPGTIENWQAQHPPLYYYVLAPAYLATKNMSLAGQLLVLRAFSYLLAWTGLCIVAVAALRGRLSDRAALPTLFAVSAWPLLFPMWFPEMGRLGNDSLVTLLAAALFVLAWPLAASPRSRHYVLLGLVLGLGLLAKATFLPATAAILILMAWRTLRTRRIPGELSRRLGGLMIAIGLALSICAWWYLDKLIHTGSLIGASDEIRMNAAGGMIAGLANNLQLEQVIRLPWEFAVSFFWAGTWSFVRPPRIFMLPLLAAAALGFYGVYRSMRRQGVQPVERFALLTVALFLAALLYHSAIGLSTADGPAPTWFLHSMAPIFALLVGYGIFELMQVNALRRATIALMLYPLLFLPPITAMSALYFAGCAPKLPGRLYFSLSNVAGCIADLPRMYQNLSVLAHPGLGLGLFVVGWAIAAVAMTIAVRQAPAESEECRCLREPEPA